MTTATTLPCNNNGNSNGSSSTNGNNSNNSNCNSNQIINSNKNDNNYYSNSLPNNDKIKSKSQSPLAVNKNNLIPQLLTNAAIGKSVTTSLGINSSKILPSAIIATAATTTEENISPARSNTSNNCDRTSAPDNGAVIGADYVSSNDIYSNSLSQFYGQRSASLPSVLLGDSTASRTMQNDEEFNIRFVNLVRKYKCLYDRKAPEYRNRDNQEKAWLSISTETKESVIHCKERWRNLRACLSRYIKQQSGSEPQHKPYYLTEHMAFLLPFLKSCRNSGAALDGSIALSNLYQQQQQQHHQQQQPISLVLLKEQAEITNNFINNQKNNNNLNNNNPNNNTLGLTNIMQASSFQINDLSQQQNLLHTGGLNEQYLSHLQLSQHHSYLKAMKSLMSEQDDEDEETLDAFDTNLAAINNDEQAQTTSPNIQSDTGSPNSMQNFIPDVQLSEIHTPELIRRLNVPNLQTNANECNDVILQQHSINTAEDQYDNDNLHYIQKPKRIKSEFQSNEAHNITMATINNDNCNFYQGERADMEFLRSILPDMACLTPQQKRKFKIGILELLDDIIERYPVERSSTSITTPSHQNAIGNRNNRFSSVSREWRK